MHSFIHNCPFSCIVLPYLTTLIILSARLLIISALYMPCRQKLQRSSRSCKVCDAALHKQRSSCRVTSPAYRGS